MIHNLMRGLVMAVITLAAGSCTHHYYAPGMHNVPMLARRGDVQATAGVGAGMETHTREVQMAVAVHDHVGIMASYMSANGKRRGNPESGEGYCSELASGYFIHTESDFFFEAYGGMAVSRQTHVYQFFPPQSGPFPSRTPELTYAKLWFAKFFVQPAIGASNEWLDLSFSNRVSLLRYDQVEFEEQRVTPGMSADFSAIKNNASIWLMEPALTARFGFKYIKIHTQLGFCAQVDKPAIRYEKLNFNIGLRLYFSRRFDENEKKNNNSTSNDSEK